MHFQKQDLIGTHYAWPPFADASFYGQPGFRLFDINNGSQLLFLINFYGSLSQRTSISEGRQFERLIATALPAGVHTELAVFNWLRQN